MFTKKNDQTYKGSGRLIKKNDQLNRLIKKYEVTSNSKPSFSKAVKGLNKNKKQKKLPILYEKLIGKKNLTPSLTDPKLWMIKCKYGQERLSVLQLMQKFHQYLNKPTKKLYVFSAFTTGQNAGYVYIEAYKEIHVIRAIQGMESLNKKKIKLLTLKDMIRSLHVKTNTLRIKQGQWIRLRKGQYKDDLAEVFKVFDQGLGLIVKVIPRVNLNKNPKSTVKHKFKYYKMKPPKKLFYPSEIRHPKQNVEKIYHSQIGKIIYRFQGKNYYNGFLLLYVNSDTVDINVKPLPDETYFFLKRKQLNYSRLEDSSNCLNLENIKFELQDIVKISSGPLKNLIGKVLRNYINLEGKTIVTIMPRCNSIKQPLEFEAATLKKFFLIGEQVKVILGPFKGETGLIVKIDEERDILFIFCDMTSKEIQVKINLVIKTTEVSRGKNWFNQYNLHDLVQLNTCNNFGIIIQVQIGQFTILNNSNDLQIIRLNEIIRKIDDRQTVALDKNFQQIQVGDIVLPLNGQFQGKRCTVKHIFRISLFLHNPFYTKNSGIFVFIARQTVLTNNIFKFSKHSKDKLINENHLKMNNRTIKEPYEGETITIIKGQWKGYLGIVKTTTEKYLQIELHAKCININVKRKNVKKYTLKDPHLEKKSTVKKQGDWLWSEKNLISKGKKNENIFQKQSKSSYRFLKQFRKDLNHTFSENQNSISFYRIVNDRFYLISQHLTLPFLPYTK